MSSLSDIYIDSPAINTNSQSDSIPAQDLSKLAHPHHPHSVVYSSVHSWCLTSFNGVNPPLQHHPDYFANVPLFSLWILSSVLTSAN